VLRCLRLGPLAGRRVRWAHFPRHWQRGAVVCTCLDNAHGRDSLGGTARTTMIVHCKQTVAHYRQTLVSLTYAARAKLIKNSVKCNLEDAATDFDVSAPQRVSPPPSPTTMCGCQVQPSPGGWLQLLASLHCCSCQQFPRCPTHPLFPAPQSKQRLIDSLRAALERQSSELQRVDNDCQAAIRESRELKARLQVRDQARGGFLSPSCCALTHPHSHSRTHALTHSHTHTHFRNFQKGATEQACPLGDIKNARL
jgi:hypothetical protein